ncbi:MAG: hypothetical protein QOE07_1708 [Acidimicrobiaceae bacterium]|jgi:hypothetical protein|nr:hypothetical protein [Acidimicrobiaceae bacterium]MDQ1443096.1 hypothetical protein [Acidimicrobiaceae bacterium]
MDRSPAYMGTFGEKKFRPTQLTRRGRVSRFVCFCHTSIRSGYLLAT